MTHSFNVAQELGYSPAPEHIDEFRCIYCGKPLPAWIIEKGWNCCDDPETCPKPEDDDESR